MLIRKAETGDISAMLDIYNYEVLNGTATLDIKPRTIDEWREWFGCHNCENHPLYVGEIDGKVAGYASLSVYRTKEAYKSTVELSIYVANEYKRRGIGTKLLDFIIREARRDERTHCVVSVITSGNEASAKLHRKFGFTYCGTIPEVGEKFGRYLGIENYVLIV